MNNMVSHIRKGLLVLAFCAPVSGRTIYVDVDATGANRGYGWTHAYTSLSLGISRASAGDEVWVAEGTYGAITLKTGVKVYGGFAATETSASQSDPSAHPTFISKTGGDRPVTSIGNDSSTVLRGFYITGGSLLLADYPTIGSGMYLENSDAMFVRCVFTGNTAEVIAGGVANKDGSPTFVNCEFDGNDGGWSCGAFYNIGAGAPAFVNCLFYENVAQQGGAVCDLGGSITFDHCTFADNQGTTRSAIYDYGGNMVFRNCILWGNTAGNPAMNPFENVSGATTATYSCVQDDDPSDANIYAGTGNIDDDPRFVSAAGDDYRLRGIFFPLSPCKDAGNDADIAADSGDLDWDGNTSEFLPFDLTADVARKRYIHVDMGAYEWTDASSQQSMTGWP